MTTMNRWIRPAALSLGLAVLAILFLINNWTPLRGVLYALGWAIVTAVVFWVEHRYGRHNRRAGR